MRTPPRRRLLAPLLTLAVLAGVLGDAGPVQAAPALTPGPVVPVSVTAGVAFETTLATFTDAEPGTLPGDAGYVGLLYQDLLGRPLDTTWWTDQLATGTSRRQVADTLVRSEEWRARVVLEWWLRYLGRPPDAPAAWSAALAGGWSVEDLRTTLIASPEYRTRVGGTNAAFVEALFVDALGRSADPPSAAFFDSLLTAGVPHPVVADYVLSSNEARRLRAATLVQTLLRRAATPDELDRYAASLASFGEASTVVSIVTTDEYDRLQPSTYAATVSLAGSAPTSGRVVRRLDGSFGVVAPVLVPTAGSHTLDVTVRRSTGETFTVAVPVVATRARNETYLDAVATEVLGRTLAPGQVADQLARIPAGGTRTRARVALDLLVGDESRQRIAAGLYRDLLGREAGPDEARYWAAVIASSNLQVVRALLLGSDEVVAQAGGSDAAWLDLVYRRALGRPIDPDALAYWSSLRATRLPRPYVAYGILLSEESRQRTAERWSFEVLGRPPTPDERALGTFLVGIPPFELGFPALLLGGDAFYAAHTGAVG
ncbi:MAG: DUF4214 domain-containing protein [Acidimicrobiales bacterium]|jgi:hypothetical protein|nr:DUF4214 domain-containing protein [Acidimicrobiales bacterium]